MQVEEFEKQHNDQMEFDQTMNSQSSQQQSTGSK